ncbi:3-oxoacyl-[acyl-carrier-protein] reductase FabG-like, partial [Solanum tuberosum]
LHYWLHIHQSILIKMEPWKDLSGKVVMVTGASSGIGLEFCLDLAKAGCNIIAAARRVDRLKSLCNQINSNSKGPPRAIAIQLDVTSDGATIESAVQIAWDAFGHIDALVNNAGITGNVHSSLELPEKEWDNVFNTNLKGAWLVSKYVCRRMRDAKQGGGSVINISSLAGLNRGVFTGSLAYATSKMALDMLTKIMAVELGVDKIRVNSIAPGYFKSEITGSLMQKKWFDNYTRRTVPLRTLGTIDPALTSMVRYLIHDSSKYVSGNVFIVDAGTSLPGVPIFSSL